MVLRGFQFAGFQVSGFQVLAGQEIAASGGWRPSRPSRKQMEELHEDVDLAEINLVPEAGLDPAMSRGSSSYDFVADVLLQHMALRQVDQIVDHALEKRRAHIRGSMAKEEEGEILAEDEMLTIVSMALASSVV